MSTPTPAPFPLDPTSDLSPYKRVILVTGSNQGVGYGLVRALAAKGENVWLSSRDEGKGRDAVTKLKQEDNLEVKYVQLDVEDEESIKRAKDVIEREEGRLDVLINNAGMAFALSPKDHPAITVSKSHLQSIFSINVIALVNTTTIFLPLLRVAARGIIPPTSLYNSGSESSPGGNGGGGSIPIPNSPHFAVILNVTSTLASLSSAAKGERADNKVCGYRMSKAAVSSYTINLNNELKEERSTNSGSGSGSGSDPAAGAEEVYKGVDIRVNTVSPGTTRTRMVGFMNGWSVDEAVGVLLPWVLMAKGESERTGKFWSPEGEMEW